MTAKIQLNQSVHNLGQDYLDYEEIIAQSIFVNVSVARPAANLALISTSASAGILLSFLTNGRQKSQNIFFKLPSPPPAGQQ
jgi:hypothetical protein